MKGYKVVRFHVDGYLAVHDDELQSDTMFKIKHQIEPFAVVNEVGVFKADV